MLSIVIPSRGEGDGVIAAIEDLRTHGTGFDVVVAAHGETDAVRNRIRNEPRTRWVECPRACRGEQLALGAQAAQGDTLLFLHADSRLPPDALRQVERCLGDPRVAGGAFRLRFDARHPALALLTTLSALPWRVAFLGDQALFCRRADYLAVGGFPAWPLFEDVELARRLARRGRLARIPQPVVTSARRFVAAGPWRQLARNGALLALFHTGVDPARLARWYAS